MRPPGKGKHAHESTPWDSLKARSVAQDAKAAACVWARVKGYPSWPAQVLTKSAARTHLSHVPHKQKTDVPVIFFGTSEIAWIGHKDVCTWEEGMRQQLHQKGRKNKKFVIAMDQVARFLAVTGERCAPDGWWCNPPPRTSYVEPSTSSEEHEGACSDNEVTDSEQSAAGSDGESEEPQQRKPPRKAPPKKQHKAAAVAPAAAAADKAASSDQHQAKAAKKAAAEAARAAKQAAKQQSQASSEQQPAASQGAGASQGGAAAASAGQQHEQPPEAEADAASPATVASPPEEEEAVADPPPAETSEAHAEQPPEEDGMDVEQPAAVEQAEEQLQQQQQAAKAAPEPEDAVTAVGAAPAAACAGDEGTNVTTADDETMEDVPADADMAHADEDADPRAGSSLADPDEPLEPAEPEDYDHDHGEIDDEMAGTVEHEAPDELQEAAAAIAELAAACSWGDYEDPPPESEDEYGQHVKRGGGGRGRGGGRGGGCGRRKAGDRKLLPMAPPRPQPPQPPPTQHLRLVSAPAACCGVLQECGSRALSLSARVVLGAAAVVGCAAAVGECSQNQMGHRYYRALYRSLGYLVAESDEEDEWAGALMPRPAAKRQKLPPRPPKASACGAADLGPLPLGVGEEAGALVSPAIAAATAAAAAALCMPARRRAGPGGSAGGFVHAVAAPAPAPPAPRPNVPLESELLTSYFQQGPLLPVDEQGAPGFLEFPLPRGYLLNRPPRYEPLRRNVWVSRERPKRQSKDDISVCCCRPYVVKNPDGTETRAGCDDNCLNRLSYIHCDPRTCPCGNDCTNRPFHLLKGPRMEVFLTTDRGHGVRALHTVPRGAFIVEYAGEVIDEHELMARMQDYREQGEQHFYIMELMPGFYIDARKRGTLARLLNSSCDPNCETQKWYDAATGEVRIGIFTTRPIGAGEELTYDYMFEHYGVQGAALGFKCCCGAPNCRGTMDTNPDRRKDWGRRVEVFWEGDGVYYRGMVIAYSVSSRKHTVLYDDGDTERVCLDEVPHRWLEDEAVTPRLPVPALSPLAQPTAPSLLRRLSSGLAVPLRGTPAAGGLLGVTEDESEGERDLGPGGLRKRRVSALGTPAAWQEDAADANAASALVSLFAAAPGARGEAALPPRKRRLLTDAPTGAHVHTSSNSSQSGIRVGDDGGASGSEQEAGGGGVVARRKVPSGRPGALGGLARAVSLDSTGTLQDEYLPMQQLVAGLSQVRSSGPPLFQASSSASSRGPGGSNSSAATVAGEPGAGGSGNGAGGGGGDSSRGGSGSLVSTPAGQVAPGARFGDLLRLVGRVQPLIERRARHSGLLSAMGASALAPLFCGPGAPPGGAAAPAAGSGGNGSSDASSGEPCTLLQASTVDATHASRAALLAVAVAQQVAAQAAALGAEQAAASSSALPVRLAAAAVQM